jgi:hypothetical protein
MCRTALVYNKALTFSVDCIRGVAIANDKLMDQAPGRVASLLLVQFPT